LLVLQKDACSAERCLFCRKMPVCLSDGSAAATKL
jgi:hypothetical protein